MIEEKIWFNGELVDFVIQETIERRDRYNHRLAPLSTSPISRISRY